MNKTILLICFLLPCFNCFGQDLDAILERNTEAHGGASNFSGVRNVRFLLTIKEPDFEVSGTYVATRDGSMRIDIESEGQRVFSEGLFQGRAWQWTPEGGPKEQDETSAAALRHGIDLPSRFFSIEQVGERGASVTLVGEVTESNSQQWQVRVVLPDGFSRDYYIDKGTGLIVRERDFRAFHPAIDATRETVETRFAGEQWVNGVLRYTRSENFNAETGKWMATTSVRSIEHNVEVEDDYFQPRQE